MKFFDHLTDRGPRAPARSQTDSNDLEEPAGALEGRLCHEQFITGKIHSLLKIARKENDFRAEPLLRLVRQ